MSNNIIQLNQDAIKVELKDLVKNSIEETLNAMLDNEAEQLVNAEKYERSAERSGYRAGHYERSYQTTAGDIKLKMPKLKGVQFENRWIKLAEKIPWDYFEAKYVTLFPSKTGNVAKPLRMALGALIIQTKFQYADRELVQQITENAYLQYFIGLPGYQDEAPFDPSDLVDFRKRISLEILNEANDYIIGKAKKDDDKNDKPGDGQSGGNAKDPENTQDRTGAAGFCTP